tara:strand:- start:391 stop:864 length:474 start_codon:yes stop_codon:yes gene_type:complete
MGYTHYWTIFQEEIPHDIWFNFAHDFIKVLPYFYEKLDHTTDQKSNVDSEYIHFNGIGEQSHETFTMNRKNPMEKSYIDPDNESLEYFDFCKTARKEYDIAVCCALIIAKKYFGNIIKVSSDGIDEDGWDKAKELCQDILKYGNTFDISYENGGVFK